MIESLKSEFATKVMIGLVMMSVTSLSSAVWWMGQIDTKVTELEDRQDKQEVLQREARDAAVSNSTKLDFLIQQQMAVPAMAPIPQPNLNQPGQ